LVLFFDTDMTFAWVAILRLQLLKIGIVLVADSIVILQDGVRTGMDVESQGLAVVTRQGQAVGHGVVPRQGAGEAVEVAVDEQTTERIVTDDRCGLAITLYTLQIDWRRHAGTGNGSKVAGEAVLWITQQARLT